MIDWISSQFPSILAASRECEIHNKIRTPKIWTQQNKNLKKYIVIGACENSLYLLLLALVKMSYIILADACEATQCLTDLIEIYEKAVDGQQLTAQGSDLIAKLNKKLSSKKIELVHYSVRDGFVFEFLCKTRKAVNKLKKMYKTGRLHVYLTTFLNSKSKDGARLTLSVLPGEFERAENYFSFKGITHTNLFCCFVHFSKVAQRYRACPLDHQNDQCRHSYCRPIFILFDLSNNNNANASVFLLRRLHPSEGE